MIKHDIIISIVLELITILDRAILPSVMNNNSDLLSQHIRDRNFSQP